MTINMMHGTNVKIIITILQSTVTKNFPLSQILKTKLSITEASSSETAHLKKVSMENICVTVA